MVTGSIAVSAVGAADYADTDIDKSGSTGYFSPIDHCIDWITVGTSITRKTISNSLYLLRNRLPSIFSYVDMYSSHVVYFTKSHASEIINDNTIIYKNNILLKLLI